LQKFVLRKHILSSAAHQASVLSKRVQSIKESPTLAITAKAGKYKTEGRPIIGLAAGEPNKRLIMASQNTHLWLVFLGLKKP
jgi:hypothetical protein